MMQIDVDLASVWVRCPCTSISRWEVFSSPLASETPDSEVILAATLAIASELKKIDIDSRPSLPDWTCQALDAL